MTKSWKTAIRAKRKATKEFAKERTAENWELKRKASNEAPREQRLPIKAYWEETTNEMKTQPRDFFRAFKPFLGSKKAPTGNNMIQIKVDSMIEKDQNVVAYELSKYFSILADGIGGSRTLTITEDEFLGHESIKSITRNYRNVFLFGHHYK